MDGFTGFNQIKMHPGDEEHTAVKMPLGIYCYTVMPFGIKNARATYQCATSILFKEHLYKIMERYVDDIVVKIRNKEDHLQNLRTVLNLMRKHHLKMNLAKSFLGLSRGKFLGFIVTSKGIYLNLDKVRAIKEMQPPPKSKRPERVIGKAGLHQLLHLQLIRAMPVIF